tara:strand:- start:55 stop:438 length:384 start_codon:yes stop_codon:yes gene_type:complete
MVKIYTTTNSSRQDFGQVKNSDIIKIFCDEICFTNLNDKSNTQEEYTYLKVTHIYNRVGDETYQRTIVSFDGKRVLEKIFYGFSFSHTNKMFHMLDKYIMERQVEIVKCPDDDESDCDGEQTCGDWM